MLNKVLILMLLLLIGVVGVVTDYLLVDRESLLQKSIKITETTNLIYPTFRVSWYEPRVKLSESQNQIYPDMPSLNRLNFIYRGEN
jgi:hypothetical protein